jgi:Zn-dependent membrane protease YugP
MFENWEKILTTDGQSKSEISKMVLENHGVQAVIMNKKDSSYLLGVFELYVPKDQAALARQILDNEFTD